MDNFRDRSPIEEQISQWREFLRRRQAIHPSDVQELEAHLRDQVTALTDAGLAEDEAFLVAVKRMGDLDELSREFAQEHSERLWKQLVIGAGASGEARHTTRGHAGVVLGLAAAAAVAIKLPELFGQHMHGGDEMWYGRNLSLFVLPLLTGYFAWRRGLDMMGRIRAVVAFLAAALVANVFPFPANSHTAVLNVLHLPIALWLVVGVAYTGGKWPVVAKRMDFVRFSGELFIYYVLIALGGGVLTGFTLMMFRAIGIDAERLAESWMVPCGAMAAFIVGAWLVEAKQSVVENMAPVLTRLFTPLFTLAILTFLITMLWTRNAIQIEREVLIGFDLLLALIAALVLYATSARDPQAPPDNFDRLLLGLIAVALVADAVAMNAILRRITEFGSTPNRVAALGENIILLVNLTGSALLYVQFLRGRRTFASLERWQTAYLPVYSAWAALVVIVFPPLFGYL